MIQCSGWVLWSDRLLRLGAHSLGARTQEQTSPQLLWEHGDRSVQTLSSWWCSPHQSWLSHKNCQHHWRAQHSHHQPPPPGYIYSWSCCYIIILPCQIQTPISPNGWISNFSSITQQQKVGFVHSFCNGPLHQNMKLKQIRTFNILVHYDKQCTNEHK